MLVKSFSDNFEQISLSLKNGPAKFDFPVMTICRESLYFNKACNNVIPWNFGDRIVPNRYKNKLMFKKNDGGVLKVTGTEQFIICNNELTKYIRNMSGAKYWRITVDNDDVYAEEMEDF